MIDEAVLRAAMDALDAGIALVEPDGRIRYCNAAYAGLLDVPPELLVGASVLGAAAPCEAIAERALDLAEGRAASFSGENEDGAAIDVALRAIDDSDLRLVLVRRGLVRTVPPRWLPPEVVADLRDFLRALTGHASEDPALGRAPLSILVLSVENLDEIRRLGGDAGAEEMLRRVAQVLVLEKRKSDVVSRFGDGQFLVLAPETPGHHASLLAERFRRGAEVLETPGRGRPAPRLRFTATEYRPLLDGSIREAVERAASAAAPDRANADARTGDDQAQVDSDEGRG